jgi:hypothetical protein
MLAEGKLVTAVRERILTKAHWVAEREKYSNPGEELAVKKIEA